MAESKEDMVKRGYQAFIDQDMDTLGAMYTDDVVQNMPGNNQLSGEHKGRDNVMALYGKLGELSGGTFAVKLKSVKADGDTVIGVHNAKAERDGKSLDDDETINFSFNGDKISRLDVTSGDQAAVDDFWG